MEDNFVYTKVSYDPFAKGEIEKIISPSEAQKEVLLSCFLGEEHANLSYNESISLDLKGKLNYKFLKNAIGYAINKHESLRMIFSSKGSYGIVLKETPINFVDIDLMGLSNDEQETALYDLCNTEASTVFSLSDGPLIRFRLIKLSNTWHQLMIVAHHVICDGWSFGLILEELAKSYNAQCQNEYIGDDIGVQISDYIEYTQSEEGRRRSQKAETYWLEKFKESVPVLDLPTPKERPKTRSYEGKRLDFKLEEDIKAAIKSLSAASKSSLVHTLKSLFEILIYKISGQNDFIVGFPAAGQNLAGFELVVGHCVNLLPTRVQIQENKSVLEFIKQRKNEVLDDLEYQNLTFGTLLQRLKIEREGGRIPLVPVVFNVDLGMDELVSFNGLQSFVVSNPRLFENFEIFFNVTQRDKGLVLEWSYNTELFDDKLITYWMNTLEWIIQDVAFAPEMAIERVLCQSTDFSNSLLQINHTEVALRAKSSFLEHFIQNAANDPEAIAIIVGNKSVTYRQLDELSLTVSQNLRALQLPKGSIVTLYLQREVELIVALLGIARSGLTYLPIDPSMPKDRVDYILEDAKTSLVISQADFRDKIHEGIDVYLVDQLISSTRGQDVGEERLPSWDDLAYLLYTSGSTGKPKGTKISHGNLLNFLESMAISPGISKMQKVLAITSISFDISGLELLLPLIAGATVVLATSDEHKDGKAIAQLIAKQDVDIMQGTPSTFKMLKALGWEPPQTLKILCGGEPLFPDLAKFLLKNSSSLWNMYGPTETTIWSTIKEVLSPESITVGSPIANTQLYILSAKGDMVPLGSTGEICIGGLGVSKGYLNKELLTGEKFVIHPSNPSLGMIYKTGDIGRINLQGELECFGRMDDQVKIRGFRIELGEIEAVLSSLSMVKNAVVLAKEESEERYLAAFIVLDKELEENANQEAIKEIRTSLAEKLPDYMVPTAWSVLLELPLTTSQKVDRLKLGQLKINKTERDVLEIPKSKLEITIAEIWKKFLKIEKIGMEEDFFELGGHSLMAVEAVSAIEKELNIEMSINSIFKFKTIQSLAANLSDIVKEKDEESSLVEIKPTGSKKPLYIVHGVGCSVTSYYRLAEVIDADQPLIGFQVKGISGKEEPNSTLEEMAAHYIKEMLNYQKEGPYSIAGYSFGGYVAYEMARQLKSMGKDLAHLIIFDTTILEDEPITFMEKLKHEFGKRKAEAGFFRKYPADFMENKAKVLTNKIEKYFGKSKQKAKDGIPESRKEIIKRLTANNNRMLNLYSLSPAPITLYLFKSEVKKYYIADKENYGWDQYVDRVHTVDLPGHHDNMFKDPAVLGVLAEKIKNVLSR